MASPTLPSLDEPDAERLAGSVARLGAESLTALALDLHWAWNHCTDELWKRLDPELWAATHNPWVVLQTVSRKRLEAFLAQPHARECIEGLLDYRRRQRTATTWFQQAHPDAPLTGIAYFSMEFALSEALPIYSGGLGNVAADQLKAACDLGVPVIGIGLLYQRGYFRQVIRPDGAQDALYPYNEPGQLPITAVRDANGEWLRVPLSLPGSPIQLRVWQVRVDRVALYLLDSNDPANPPAARIITSDLYGGGAELRLQQELVLGIGGWRVLRALGLKPEVCHLNEGHAALVVLERARSFAADRGCPFDVALAATRAGNLFTTHTAVQAGFDRFEPALIARYLGRYAEDELRISLEHVLALGRARADDPTEEFNMAYLAVRGSAAVNGVSRLHGAVSRRLFGPVFPRWPESEVPIQHVTNGVHVPTWDSASADALWTMACGCGCWRHSTEGLGAAVRRGSDAQLWAMRNANRKALIAYVRERLPRELAAAGVHPERVARSRTALNPDALTLGFARRFASYKRPTLLLQSRERLVRLLANPERPVQLVIAGKAHPADEEGQAMIAEWVRFIRRPDVEGRVVFVPDYDLLLAQHLVQGVDLWINAPRRPWEASGTSGMKVLVNGGLNLSELDGWWAEAYSPDVGWALGDGVEHADTVWDTSEAEALYTLLEQEVVPAFYTRDTRGIPTRWVAKMRQSMATLTPQFSANRVVRHYTERYYLPAAAAFRARAADNGALAAQLVAWRRHLLAHWEEVRFGAVHVESRGGQHEFTVEVHLGQMNPDWVCVELFANTTEDGEVSRHVMTRRRAPEALGADAYEYWASVANSRPAEHYVPRLIPHHPEVRTPLEAPEILWQR